MNEGFESLTEEDVQRLERDAAQWKAEHPNFENTFLLVDGAGEVSLLIAEG